MKISLLDFEKWRKKYEVLPRKHQSTTVARLVHTKFRFRHLRTVVPLAEHWLIQSKNIEYVPFELMPQTFTQHNKHPFSNGTVDQYGIATSVPH